MEDSNGNLVANDLEPITVQSTSDAIQDILGDEDDCEDLEELTAIGSSKNPTTTAFFYTCPPVLGCAEM